MENKYVLVNSSVLPEVYLKVLEAKEFLESGEAKTAKSAAKMAGISRSAYYKYKDYVYSYQRNSKENVITVFATLKDRAGALSELLLRFYKSGANILTVNQNIPIDGMAFVTITARIDELDKKADKLISDINALENVITIQRVSGD